MNKQLIPALLLTFVNTIGFSILIPVLPFVTDAYNAGPVTYGVLLTSYSLFQFLAAPFLGSLSDKYGRRPILLISQTGTLLSWLVFGIAYYTPNLQVLGFSLPIVIIAFSRVVDGITGGNISVTNAYIADISPEDQRTKNFGFMGATMGLGFLIGPALGGFSASLEIGYLGTVIVAGLISLVTLILMFTNLKEPLRNEDLAHELEINFFKQINLYSRVKQLGKSPILKNLFFRRVFFAFAFACFTSTFTLYAKDFLGLDVKELGFILLFIGIFSVLNQTVIVPRVAKKFGNKNTFELGQIILAISIAIFAIQPDLTIFIIDMYLTNLGMSLSMPTFKTMLTNSADKKQRGEVTGVDESILAGQNALAPLIAGAAYATLLENSFLIFAAILLIPYLILPKTKNPAQAPQG